LAAGDFIECAGRDDGRAVNVAGDSRRGLFDEFKGQHGIRHRVREHHEQGQAVSTSIPCVSASLWPISISKTSAKRSMIRSSTLSISISRPSNSFIEVTGSPSQAIIKLK